MRFINLWGSSGEPQDRNQADGHGGKNHEFGTEAFGGTFDDGLVEALPGKRQVLAFRLFVRKIEIKQHEPLRQSSAPSA